MTTTLTPPPDPARDHVELMGLPLHGVTRTGAVEHLIAESAAGRGGYVMTPNLDNLYRLARDPDLMDRALGAELRVADGMPLLWASRIKGRPLPARVAGSDLILSLADAIACGGGTLFLLGGEPGTAERAGEELRRRAPGLNVVGTYCPPFGYERDRRELDEIRDRLVAARPQFVYVGLPFPKASRLISELRRSLPGTWFLGLGISFSFVCGDISRAPAWMQKLGLEWLHRLIQEPRRLARRYLVEGGPFALRLFWRSYLDRRAERGS
ncbi:MAG TPA: WecB/TagA/CpsF family glycosyltransferase [Solirubrobacteraceae bacterium]|jgi:N-acetylglucosaminyldiphosphoundecaprenol N-acetyl-beta-D-mannosaminyltransferase|nr:WecB/TagA/CpsF family glycosyltransferase [Solirubrobacteraceae bacterium]